MYTILHIHKTHSNIAIVVDDQEKRYSKHIIHSHLCSLINNRDASLLSFLPKTLGFAVGLEFRDNTLLLNSSNSTQFSDGMRSLPCKSTKSISFILLLYYGIFAYLVNVISITNLACLT